MTGFLPSSTNLNQLDELVNLSHTITYTSLLGGSFPVTVTAVDTNQTVNVSGATISGYYSDSFVNDIQYRTPQDTFVNVPKWDEINLQELDELIYYKADTTPFKEYTYIATANGESKTYVVTVTNNWTPGRDELLRYVGITKGEQVVSAITWINSSATPVTWVNSAATTINWVNIV
jgi:hypothetical protein